MLMLGLDTATPVTTVAVVRTDDGVVQLLAERSHRDPRRHGEVLPRQISEVLDEVAIGPADLEAVAVGVGPGAFTGLRVGLATAQALGLALSIPVHGVVTLDAIALACGRQSPFAVVTDARRREVFWATYADATHPLSSPVVGTPDEAVDVLRGMEVVGLPETPELLGVTVHRVEQPSAAAICAVAARATALIEPTPLYLRRPDVTASSGPKSVLP